jgi:AAA family ATP:ADP antiporter
MQGPPPGTTRGDARPPGQRRGSILARALAVFSRVHPDEGVVVVLMTACVFLILSSYYLLKTAREGLILSGGTFGLRGDELKTYATGAMALVCIAAVPAYGALAGRVRRIRLINVSYAVVMACLLAFYGVGRAGVPIGLAFFVWLGLVSLFLVGQFWSYANDLYSEDEGKRLFGIIAIGGSAGAILGPRLTRLADTFSLLLMAAVLLAGCVVLFNAIERIQGRRAATPAPEPVAGRGGFALVMRDRYLLLIAGLLMVANLVNTTGEYVLSNAAADHAATVVPAASFPELVGAARDAAITAARRDLIKRFYGDFFFWVNLVGFLVQAFIVSRFMDKLGVRAGLFVLPLVALGAYAAIAVVGGIALVRAAKVAENATDYSMQNTVRQALFLRTDRAAKYKAKNVIDTFFVRFGDTLSALLVGFGIHQVGLGARQLAYLNVGLVALWLLVAVGLARRHRALDPVSPAVAPVPAPPPGGRTWANRGVHREDGALRRADGPGGADDLEPDAPATATSR